MKKIQFESIDGRQVSITGIPSFTKIETSDEYIISKLKASPAVRIVEESIQPKKDKKSKSNNKQL